MDDGRPPTKRAREEERIGVCAKILGSFGYSAKSRSQQNMAPAALETKGSTRVDNSINVVVITNGRHEKKKKENNALGKEKVSEKVRCQTCFLSIAKATEVYKVHAAQT